MVKSDGFGPIPGYDWQKVTVVAFVHLCGHIWDGLLGFGY